MSNSVQFYRNTSSHQSSKPKSDNIVNFSFQTMKNKGQDNFLTKSFGSFTNLKQITPILGPDRSQSSEVDKSDSFVSLQKVIRQKKFIVEERESKGDIVFQLYDTNEYWASVDLQLAGQGSNKAIQEVVNNSFLHAFTKNMFIPKQNTENIFLTEEFQEKRKSGLIKLLNKISTTDKVSNTFIMVTPVHEYGERLYRIYDGHKTATSFDEFQGMLGILNSNPVHKLLRQAFFHSNDYEVVKILATNFWVIPILIEIPSIYQRAWTLFDGDYEKFEKVRFSYLYYICAIIQEICARELVDDPDDVLAAFFSKKPTEEILRIISETKKMTTNSTDPFRTIRDFYEDSIESLGYTEIFPMIWTFVESKREGGGSQLMVSAPNDPVKTLKILMKWDFICCVNSIGNMTRFEKVTSPVLLEVCKRKIIPEQITKLMASHFKDRFMT